MNKLIASLFLFLLPIISNAEKAPDQNDEGMKKVQGVVVEIDHVDSSHRGSTATGMPIYQVKVSESIKLEVASKESFRVGDCVLVWYDEGMGESPNLSMLGQAGISRSHGCNK